MLNLKTLTIAAVAASTIALTIPANAAIGTSYKVETKVRVIDLETEAGLTKVYNQLRTTAERECRVNRPMGITERRLAEDCAKNLLDDFVNSVDDIRLTRLHSIETVS